MMLCRLSNISSKAISGKIRDDIFHHVLPAFEAKISRLVLCSIVDDRGKREIMRTCLSDGVVSLSHRVDSVYHVPSCPVSLLNYPCTGTMIHGAVEGIRARWQTRVHAITSSRPQFQFRTQNSRSDL